jgi:hypothetical protein
MFRCHSPLTVRAGPSCFDSHKARAIVNCPLNATRPIVKYLPAVVSVAALVRADAKQKTVSSPGVRGGWATEHSPR